MEKQELVDYLKMCQELYDKHESLRADIGLAIGQLSIAINLSGESGVLKEVIEECKDKYTVTKYLGEIVCSRY